MTLTTLVSLYLLLNLGIGVAASRLVNGISDFFSASRKLPFMLSSFALFALWFGSETLFGASAEFIQNGLLGVIEDPFGGALCLLLFGLVLVRPLYRANLLTLGDLFRRAYGPRTEYLSALCMILTFIGYIAGQLIALSLMFTLIYDVETSTALLLSTLFVTLYTAGGGMWAVSLTDFVQSLVIMAGLVTISVYLGMQVDLSALFIPPRPGFFDFTPNTNNNLSWLDYIAAWLTLGLGSLASQDIFQRANSARTEAIAVRSTIMGALLYLAFAMLPLLLALMVFQLEPTLLAGDQQNTLILLVARHTPLWLQALFFGALLSAIFSTCSGALLAPASILAENIVKPWLLHNSNERAMLLASRCCVVVMAVIAFFVARASTSIYELVGQSSALGAVCILVPLLFALFDKRPSARGAILAMALGITTYALTEYVVAVPVPSLFVGIAASVAGMLAGKYL